MASAKRSGSSSELADCYLALGLIHNLQAKYEDAVRYHEEAYRINVERGSMHQVARNLMNVGLAYFYLGHVSTARQRLQRAYKTYAEIGVDRGRALASLMLSRMERRYGDIELSVDHAELALRLASGIGFRRAEVLALEELGDSAAAQGKLLEAEDLYRQALDAGREIAARGDLVYELAWRLARVRLMRNDPDEAESLAQEALDLATSASDHRERYHALATLALIRSAAGRSDEARSLAEQAIEGFRSILTPYELASAHEIAATVIGTADSGSGDATSHLLEARRLYARLGSRGGLARVEEALRSQAGEPSAAGSGSEPAFVHLDLGEVPGDAIAEDPEMLDVLRTAAELSSIDNTVLIEGPTGCGKEVVARIIHHAGPRRDRPFVALNCAAFPSHLLESELFGHRKGAFTGADRNRVGRLVAAADGTVLLDEIDKASPDFQSKLLRVLEDRQVHPVGSNDSEAIEARIVCAANRDLRDLANQGLFLADLFYRLAGFRIEVPALRDRPADIRALTVHFLERCGGRFGAPHYSIDDAAMDALLGYDWPGNVRELRNSLESAAFRARATGVIGLYHLPPDIAVCREGVEVDPATLEGQIHLVERREIRRALKTTGGNKTEAAKLLGVSRKGLNDRLERLGMGEYIRKTDA